MDAATYSNSLIAMSSDRDIHRSENNEVMKRALRNGNPVTQYTSENISSWTGTLSSLSLLRASTCAMVVSSRGRRKTLTRSSVGDDDSATILKSRLWIILGDGFAIARLFNGNNKCSPMYAIKSTVKNEGNRFPRFSTANRFWARCQIRALYRQVWYLRKSIVTATRSCWFTRSATPCNDNYASINASKAITIEQC